MTLGGIASGRLRGRRYVFFAPHSDDAGHPRDELLSRLCQAPTAHQGLGGQADSSPPASELRMRSHSVIAVFLVALPLPESGYSEVGICPLQQAAGRAHVIAPGSVIQPSVPRMYQFLEFDKRIELGVLHLMSKFTASAMGSAADDSPMQPNVSREVALTWPVVSAVSGVSTRMAVSTSSAMVR